MSLHEINKKQLIVVYDNILIFLSIGGLTVRNKEKSSYALPSCHVYSVQDNIWMVIPNLPIDGGIHSHAMSYDNHRFVYSVGGLTAEEQVLCDVFKLDTHNLSCGWSRLSASIQPVYSHTCHIVDNKVVVVGGIGEEGEEMHVQIMDLNTLRTDKYRLPVSVDEKLRMYFNHTSHVIDGIDSVKSIMIIGGGGNCFSFGTHMNRDALAFQLP